MRLTIKKQKNLFDSLRKNAKKFRVCVLCIGFWPDDEFPRDFEYKHAKLEDMESYRKGWPENRPFYVCAEGGEFLDYFDFDIHDIIIHIDADMVMQREFTDEELNKVKGIKGATVMGSFHTIPKTDLYGEYIKLLSPSEEYARQVFRKSWDLPVFCAGLIVARVMTYRAIRTHYMAMIDDMIKVFKHHAAGQWIMSYIVGNFFNYEDLGYVFHNAEWFINTNASEGPNNKLVYRGNGKEEVVLFNHTKFLRHWMY